MRSSEVLEEGVACPCRAGVGREVDAVGEADGERIGGFDGMDVGGGL